jgi:hypothetical protein
MAGVGQRAGTGRRFKLQLRPPFSSRLSRDSGTRISPRCVPIAISKLSAITRTRGCEGGFLPLRVRYSARRRGSRITSRLELRGRNSAVRYLHPDGLENNIANALDRCLPNIFDLIQFSVRSICEFSHSMDATERQPFNQVWREAIGICG